MSDITTRTDPHHARTGLAPPAPSAGLQRLLDEYSRYEASGELHRFRPDVPPAVRDEARSLVAHRQANNPPVTMEAVLKWLTPLVAAVAQPPDEQTYRTRATAVLAACSDLPASAFSSSTSLAAVRKFQWFPSAAEVRALLMEETAPQRQLQRALRVLATQPPADAQTGASEPQNVRKALADKLRGVVAEVEAKAAETERVSAPPTQGKPLHPDHLAALRAENPLVQRARSAR